MSNATIEMPRYSCHKMVWALKIKAVGPDDENACAMLSFEDDRYGDIMVTGRYLAKHEPKAGGYFVVYEGGYRSWSPADAFEAGYAPIPTGGGS